MKVSELEFTRHVAIGQAVIDTSGHASIAFALGITIRPLLTRVQVYPSSVAAITGGAMVTFDNGDVLPGGQSRLDLRSDDRMLQIWSYDGALVASGFPTTAPFESNWWKLLLPDVGVHVVHTTLAVFDVDILLHYRFAELSDSEIVELAAQRAQG